MVRNSIVVYSVPNHMHKQPIWRGMEEFIMERNPIGVCSVPNHMHKQAIWRGTEEFSMEKPYSCSRCTKSFALAGDLKTNLRIHTVEKPYSCSQCTRSFAQASHLKSHVRIHNCYGWDYLRYFTVHTSTKLYSFALLW